MKTVITEREIKDLRQRGADIDYIIFCRVHDLIYSNSSLNSTDVLKSLPIGCQAIYSTSVVEGELYNGGFYQYYGNSTAQDFNTLAITGFFKIGAPRISALLRLVFQTILSQSRSFRETYEMVGVQEAFNMANDVYDEIEIRDMTTSFIEWLKKKIRSCLDNNI